MKTKYNQLREEIIKANEDILALKFGCEILRYKNSPDEKKYKVIEDMGFAGNDKMVWINSVPFGSMQLPIELLKSEIGDNTGDWEIIGRPISLEDCLIAIDKHFNGDGLTDKDDWGCDVGTYWVADLLKLWILGEPLQDQSEPTINLLWDLIVKK